MSDTLRLFEARTTEGECLDEIMRLAVGDAPCPACEARSGFSRARKHQAFTCRACGFSLYPCEGTPFAKSSLPLTRWFVAAQAAASTEGRTTRSIARALRLSRKDAGDVASGIETLKRRPSASDAAVSWADAMAAFVASRTDAGAAPARSEGSRETLWQSVRDGLSLPDVQRRPLLGIAVIAVLALAGAGIGWLLVPAPPEEDTELAQATAILTLASDKPVIIVSREVADQLYDVSDVDADASSPLQTSIRVAPAGAGAGRPGEVGEAAPIAQPSVKLSANVGQQLAKGDLTAVKASAASRPELAAYGALARELEGSGSRNPDEILVFGPIKVRRHLVDKIVRAATATGVDPVLLMAVADKESSFQTEVQAQTSSASGLFQFIERTWLGVVRDFGSRYGLDKEARFLATSEPAGAERTRILDLRRDAFLASVFAAEMLKRDSTRIARRIGRELTGGEVYLVHFLGPDGAERLLDQVMKKPDAVAADLLPKPAAANRTIFFGRDPEGSAKGLSVAEVHGRFETMISVRLDRYRSVKKPDREGRPPR